MDWKMLLACITGSVEEELLRNEYLVIDAIADDFDDPLPDSFWLGEP
jgi:hypothetical protein